MAVINWGIVGCGDVCEIKSGPAFNKVPHSRLVAVMRRDRAKAEDFAKRHEVPRFYDQVSDLINDPEVNAIYVATPPAFHEDQTLEALKAGKPVYVEKPVTLDAASCERMISAAQRHGNKVAVAHYRRGLPLFQTVKSLIADGALGTIRVINIIVLQQPKLNGNVPLKDQWRVDPAFSGGGLFHDLSPHQLDIMYWLFGTPSDTQGSSWNQSKSYQAPDITTLQARFGDILLNGIWAFSVSDHAKQDSCEIIGTKGKLKFGFFSNSNLEVITDDGSRVIEMHYPVNIQQPMIERVVNYFRNEGPNPCSLNDALVTMNMMDATR